MKALDEAIKHCEETVEKCIKEGNIGCSFEHRQLAEWLKELKHRRENGGKKKPIFKHGESVSCVDYVDRPGQVFVSEWAEWVCPNCGWFVGQQYLPRRHNQQKSNYCSRCGQEIDWDGVEDEKNKRTD